MKLIDIYIAKQVLVAFFTVLLVIVGLDAMFAMVEQLGNLRSDYDLFAAMQYVSLTAPRRIYEYLPLSALIGCLLGLGALASHSELIIMRAAGLSVQRIFWGVIKPVLLLVFLSALLGEFVVPQAEQKAQSFRSMKLAGGQALAARGVWHRDGNQYIHINTVLTGGEIHGVTRYQFDEEQNLRRSSFAHVGRYDSNAKLWQLEAVDSTRFVGAKTVAERIPKEVWSVGLTPTLLSVIVVEPSNLSMQGLWRYLGYLQKQGLEAASYQIAFWEKAMQPFAIVALVLVAVSFIFGPLRSVTVGQRLVVGIVVGLCFKIVQDILGPASTVFGFHPLVAVLIPIVLCLFTGGYLLKKAG